MSDKDSTVYSETPPMSVLDGFIGKRLVAVERDPQSDEGLVLHFEGGLTLTVGFSGCEGLIVVQHE